MKMNSGSRGSVDPWRWDPPKDRRLSWEVFECNVSDQDEGGGTHVRVTGKQLRFGYKRELMFGPAEENQ